MPLSEKNLSHRVFFSEYINISVQQFESEEFRAKYNKKSFTRNGEIVKLNSDIIRDLAKKMDVNAKTAYLRVKRAFFQKSTTKKKDVVTVLLENSNTDNTTANSQSRDSNGGGTDTGTDTGTNTCEMESFCDTFELGEGKIFEIYSVERTHRNRVINTQKVKPGWPYKLSIFLFKDAKISCKFDFKNIWVTKDGKVSVTGNCECKAHADISCHMNVLKVEVKNISRAFPHKRVYQMRGERKEDFSRKLEQSSAKAVQSKLVNDLIPDNTTLNTEHNPFVSSLNAFHLIRHRYCKNDADPIDVLLELKDTTFRNVVSAVSHSPFYVFYRTALQLAWYIVESKKKPIAISIDATGSLVTPPTRSQKIDGKDKLKHVCLYSVMAKTGTRSVPIMQMITQDQSSPFITFFLKKMFMDLKAPQQVVSDESKAILKSLVNTFANCEKTCVYIAACMSSLLNNTAPPKCYIRIDRSHFAKNTLRKIKYSDFRKQNLFRGIFGYLIQCDNFGTAKKIIADFFTLILNENDGYDGVTPLPSESARNRLHALCSTHNADEDYASESDVLEKDDADKDLDFSADSGWIEEIIGEVDIETSPGSHESLYYSPKEKQKFVTIFSSLVLWSNVMNPVFGTSLAVATSSDVESYFKTLKTGIFERKLYRADEFVEIHTDFISSEIKLNAISNDAGSTSPRHTKRNRSKSLNERLPLSPGEYYIITYIMCLFHFDEVINHHFIHLAKHKRSNSLHEDFMDNPSNDSDNGKLDLYILAENLYNNFSHFGSINVDFYTMIKAMSM